MLDIKFIRENGELVKKNNKNRGIKIDIDKLLELDEKRRDLIRLIDEKRALRKKTSKTKPSETEIGEMKKVGIDIAGFEKDLEKINSEFNQLLQRIPNLTHPESPIGEEQKFRVLEVQGEPPKFTFTPKNHEELLTSLDLLDFERGAKVAESKYYYFKNDLVRLNQALLNYAMNIAAKRGFVLMDTPDLAKNEILTGIGFNPRGPETQVYSIENSELSLIGTAEITVGGYHAGEVLDLEKGPLKYAALSHCFRTEAGSYGRESHGLYRVHQFTKFELFIFCKPEDSEKMHQEILETEKEICDGLEFPYRVIDIPTGDLGAPAYRKFDVEAWMTMKDGYGEIMSASNCTDYQARNLNIKYRKPDGTHEYVHTLNGTAVALSRMPIVIAENFQQADGTIIIPKVLQKFMSKDKITK